jgi:adenylate cyclase
MPGSLDPYKFRPKPTLTAREAAERAGVSYDVAKGFRRAMGMPEVDDDTVEFDEDDVEALKRLKALSGWGLSVEELTDVARVYGQAFSRIADVETHLFQQRFVRPRLEEGKSASEIEDELAPAVDNLLDLLAGSLDYVHRRHLAMALQQVTAESSDVGTELLAVGFADLVDFSRLADELQGSGISELVGRFEKLAIEICVDSDVRLAKMIGDAAMFVSPDPKKAVDAAVEIVGRVDADDLLSEARAGLDWGEAVPLGGDYFGRPINVAARITAFARPGTTVVSKSLIEKLGDVDAGKIGSHRLKGVGRVTMFKIRTGRDSKQESS